MAPVSYDGTGVTVTLVSYDTPGCRMRRVVENVAATSGVCLIRLVFKKNYIRKKRNSLCHCVRVDRKLKSLLSLQRVLQAKK